MPAPLIALALSLAAEFAPTLIRHLAGDKAGEVAETVVEAAKRVTGSDTPDEAQIALRADPQAILAFKTEMASVEIKYEEMRLADVADARARDVSIRSTGKHNVRADIMVGVDALGLIASLTVLAIYRNDLPGEVIALISTIAAYFGLGLRDAHQFEFGSSRGSKEKDDILANR